MKNRLTSFAYLLPLVELSLAMVTVFAPALRFYFHLKEIAHGSGAVSLMAGRFAMTVPSGHFLSFAFERAGWRAGWLITILNVPAKFIDVIVCLLAVHKAYWHPASLSQSAWQAVVYPLYALPAWICAGLGVDAMLGRRRAYRWNTAIGLLFALTCAALFCGFSFCMPAAEREGQEQLSWFIVGFQIWAVLFAIPFAAWLLQKSKEPSRGTKLSVPN